MTGFSAALSMTISFVVSFVRTGFVFFSSLVLVSCAAAVMIFAVNEPGCCADDAYIALVAENLAKGLGYASSLHTDHFKDYRIYEWDPAITTGPPVVIPAALLSWLTGGYPQAANIATAILNLLLMVALAAQLPASLGRRIVALSVFIVLSVVFFTEFVERLALPLGEVPSALFLAIGALLLARAPDLAARRLALSAIAGLLIAAAILTKTLTLLAAFVVCAYLGLFFLLKKLRTAPRNTFLSTTLSAALPYSCALGVGLGAFGLVEVWKYASLGPQWYPEHWASARTLFSASTGHSGESFRAALLQQSQVFQASTGLPAWTAVTSLSLVALVPLLTRNPSSRLLAAGALATGGAVMLGWWLLQEGAMIRYAFTGVLLGAISFSILVANTRNAAIDSGIAIICAALIAVSISDLRFLSDRAVATLREPVRLNELRSVASLLQSPAWISERPILTSHWATAVDIQLQMTSQSDFMPYRSSNVDWRKTYLVAVRKHFLAPGQGFPDGVLKDCNTLHDGEYYWVARCKAL
jgi:hypothetical protein